MQRYWSALARWLSGHAGLVSVVGLAVTLVLGLGITQLEFATGQESYLNSDDQVLIDNIAYQDLFGGQAMATIITMEDGHTVDELLDEEGRALFEAYHDALIDDAGIHAVITPLTILEFDHALVHSEDGNPANSIVGQATVTALGKEEPGSDAFQARLDDSAATLARVLPIPLAERTFDNPEWRKFLIYDNAGDTRLAHRAFFLDDTHAQVLVRMAGNQSIEEEGKTSELVKAAAEDLDFPNASETTTGAPVLLKEINDYLRGGMLTLGGIAVGVMAVILVLLFNVRWRLLPLLVVLVGVVWAFGLAGYLGIPLTIVTIAGLPVMLGVGIDYAIQMHSRVEEEVVIDRSDEPIEEAARGLGPALLVVTFDAIFAFLALRFAKVPMLRDFGVLLAVGVAAICICSIVVPMAALGIRERRSPTPPRDYSHGALGRLVRWLGSLPPWTAIPLTLISIVVFVGGITVEDDLTLQTDPDLWVSQDSEVIRDIRTLQREAGSSAEIGVYITSDDVFSDETIAFAYEMTRNQLREHEGALLDGTSIETSVGDSIFVEGASLIPPTGADIRAAYEAAPRDLQLATVSDDGTALNVVFRSAASSLEARAPVVRELRDDVDPPEGIRATPSGLGVVGVGLLDNLEANRVVLTYIAIGFVFAFLTVRLRSLVRALLSLVPVLIAVGAASLVAWSIDWDLSPMTAVGGPLVVAACTEFTSLILLRFIEERRRGLEPAEAMDVASARTGRAFIVSALTAVVGVAVLSLSSLPLLRDFGRIVAMNVTVALLSALVVLPPMLVWADRRNWVSRGLVHPERGEPEGAGAGAGPEPAPAPA